jgi:phosphatidylglycerol lysyltransferase
MTWFLNWDSKPIEVPTGCEYFASQSAMPPEAIAQLENYAFSYGETYDAYLATEDDRQYFWSPGRTGVIGFVRWHHVLNVVGGLLSAPEHEEQLLKEFVEFVRLNRLTVNFFNLGRREEKIFRRQKFKINKCTEELIVRLDRVNWQGKAYEWLRRQENFCVRKDLRVREIDPRTDPESYRHQIVPQLEEVNREHLASTVHGRELVFLEGRFDPWSLRRRRLFVTSEAGRIIAFVVCNPALAGDLWAIEIYRRRAAAPRGVIPFTMLHVMRQLKDEGVPYASLSSVPFLRCGPPIKNDDLRFQGACQFFWHAMNWLFDVRGIYHFKSRFRPEYREMYLATYPRMSILSMFALGASWELFRISPLRLARHVVHYWRSRKKRQELATPEPRPERKIRNLIHPWYTVDRAVEASPDAIADMVHSNKLPPAPEATAKSYPPQNGASPAYPIHMEER